MVGFKTRRSALRSMTPRAEKRGTHMKRPIFSFVLTIALTLSLQRSANAFPGQCSCSCKNSSQCSGLTWCGPEPWACRPTIGITGKRLVGQCNFWNSSDVSAGMNQNVADALEFWLLAFEAAGNSGGGPPNASLVAMANAVPLPPSIARTTRELALAVQADFLGVVADGGRFTPPPSPAACNDPITPGQNGSILPYLSCNAGVAQIIRQAMVNELRNPNQGNFQSQMSQIPFACPSYTTVGRCTYPPPDGPGVFPYPNGLTCLSEELRAPLDSLYETMTGPVPAVSGFGVVVMCLLMLVGGGIVVQVRKTRASAAT